LPVKPDLTASCSPKPFLPLARTTGLAAQEASVVSVYGRQTWAYVQATPDVRSQRVWTLSEQVLGTSNQPPELGRSPPALDAHLLAGSARQDRSGESPLGVNTPLWEGSPERKKGKEKAPSRQEGEQLKALMTPPAPPQVVSWGWDEEVENAMLTRSSNSMFQV